jgi:hypothetical protein
MKTFQARPAISEQAVVIFVRTSEPDVATLKKRYDKGRLDVRPDFQRYEVWTPQKKSSLIESLLLDLPIPRIYLAEQAAAPRLWSMGNSGS